MATVSTFSTVDAGFDRKEDTRVDGFFDLSREVNETLEVVVRPERVELMVSRLLAFGEHIEPEHRIRAILLLVGVTER